MKTYCENTNCKNRSTKEVPISVDKLSDETRSLCATCQEAYSWGLQHGTMVSKHKQLWLVAIADKGIVVYTRAYPDESAAIKGVAEYLKDYQRYQGPANSQAIYEWLEQHDENLSVDIVCQPRMSKQDNQAESTMSKKTFTITLKEQCADVPSKTIKVKLLFEGGKLWIQPKGYSDKCSADGCGYPIGLEIWQGRLRLVVFDNINVEEPKIIDLEDARENNRDSGDQDNG